MKNRFEKTKMKKAILISIILAIQTTYAQKNNELKKLSENSLNKKIAPQKNFYQFVNKNWIDTTKLTEHQQRKGIRQEVNELNHQRGLQLIHDIHQKPTSENEGKINILYNSFNQKFQNQNTIQEIRKKIQKIQKITSKNELIQLLAEHHQQGIHTLFKVDVKIDIQNIQQKCITFSQDNIEQKQLQKLVKLLYIIGLSKEEIDLNIENTNQIIQELDKVKMNGIDLENPTKTYHKFNLKNAAENFSSLQLNTYFELIKLSNIPYLIIEQPNYFKKTSMLISKLPLDIWKSYFISCILINAENMLLNEIKNEENFLKTIENLKIKEVIEHKYVKTYINEPKINEVKKLILNLQKTFQERIEVNTWMEVETKKKAIEKLQNIHFNIAHPSQWQDFSLLNLSDSSFYNNIRTCETWDFNQKMKSLLEKTVTSSWEISVYSTEVCYNAFKNEITIPAGVLQAPYFDENAAELDNYSKLGALIGHEIIHIFDPQNPFSTWEQTDRIMFDLKLKEIERLYAKFPPIEGQSSQPKLTNMEDFADIGGLVIAYYAYLKTSDYQSKKNAENFTNNQLFFISFAQLHRTKYTKQEIINRLLNDTHSIAEYRVNGALKNFKEFHKAFNVKLDDEMMCEKCKEIW